MKVMVIGGYGNFGGRLVMNLAKHSDCEIIIAGRSLVKAKEFQSQILLETGANVEVAICDVLIGDLCHFLNLWKPGVVVNASGPFQLQEGSNYRVARACISEGCHYIDLADDRAFVSGFSTALDADARSKGVMLVAGASTVPGLTGAVIDAFKPEFTLLSCVEYGISPGNRTERGEATVGSILSYTGKPFNGLLGGKGASVYGWQDLSIFDFGSPIGRRWMSNCNIPDFDVLPRRYPDIKTLKFQAGLELSILHLGLWCLSVVVRFAPTINLVRYTSVLTNMSRWFMGFGSDTGGMFIRLTGRGLRGQAHKVDWQLIAENGTGINVPAISAELLIKRIERGSVNVGASACLGFFTLEEFMSVAERWGIYQRLHIH